MPGAEGMKITGAKAHKARLKRIRSAAMVFEVGKAVYTAADLLTKEAQISITTGAVSGKNHVASDPGEAPNNDTGHLADNIRTYKTGPLTAESSSEAEYSAALEGGSTREAGVTSRSFAGKTSPYGPSKAKQGPVRVEFGDSSVAARPFMGPAAQKTRPKAQKLVVAAVKRVVNGGTL